MRKLCVHCGKEIVHIYEAYPIEQDCWIHVDNGLEECIIDTDPAVEDWESEGGRAI